jgi:hypothetical protein
MVSLYLVLMLMALLPLLLLLLHCCFLIFGLQKEPD